MNERQTNEVLRDQLVAKATALQGVEQTFAAIINVGAAEWGLASLVALGKAYDNMGDSLLNSYIPDFLNEDQRDFYQMGLEDKAYVQEEKAVNAYKLALDEAYRANLYNDNTAYATRQLGVLRPDDYPGLHETMLEPRYTSSKSTSYELETSL